MAGVESEIKIIESPVRDDIYSYRTTMISIHLQQAVEHTFLLKKGAFEK
jgi:hypothetical protein